MTVSSWLARWTSRSKNLEPLIFVLLCIGLSAASAFLYLTTEMLEGETRAFDEAILIALRQPNARDTPIGPVWLAKVLTDLTSLGGTTVLLLLTTLSVVFLFIIRKRFTALFVFLCVLGGWLVSTGVKFGVARPRPELVPHLVEVNDFSFPSGHAMLSAVTYLTLGALLSRTQSIPAARYYFIGVALLLTLLVGFSRIYLGVHYPSDVLGGWTAGAAWACLCWLLARWLLPASEFGQAGGRQPGDQTEGSA